MSQVVLLIESSGVASMEIYKTEKGMYKKIQRIASGAFSQVYIVKSVDTQRSYALTTFKGVEIPDFREHFRMAYNALKGIHHKNLVSVKEVGISSEGVSYAVTNYLEGTTTLHEFVSERKEPLDSGSVASIGIQICEGLHALHTNMIIHGDLNANNVLIAEDKSVKIIDFGLAQVPSEASLSKSPASSALWHYVGGAFGYMAPELFSDPLRRSTQSDIYSLGCVLYFLLAGLPLVGSYRRPSEIRRDIPRQWDMIIEGCSAPNPQMRFGTVDEVAEALRKLPKIGIRSVVNRRPSFDFALFLGMLAFNMGWLVSRSANVGALCLVLSWIAAYFCLRWLYACAEGPT